MSGYIAATLQKFQHQLPTRAQHAPYQWNGEDQTAPLPPDRIKRLQQITGMLLYYARAVDPTMLVSLGTIALQQSNGTEAAADAIVQLLSYCATHPGSTTRS
jgi:hypothetical protein